MRDYIILNGVNSNTITGLLISTLPPITKPKQRTTVEEIDGRDGDIVTKLGYSAYDKEIEIGLYGDFDIDDVIAYFNSEGTVTFSNEPDKFYNYQILDQIDYEKLIRFKKAKVRMHVQPFKYPLEETPVEITNQYVNNEAEEMDLDNTKEAPMTIDLKGNTSQATTTGKNLFNYIDNLQTPYRGLTSTINSDGSITTTGVPQFNYTSIIGYDITSQLENGQEYTLSQNTKQANKLYLQINIVDLNGGATQYASLNNATSVSFTANTTNKKYIMNLQTGPTADWGSSSLTITNYYQLEKGSSATSFEPYVGGIPSPNPNYPQDIHVVSGDNSINVTGKNLLGINSISGTMTTGVNYTFNNSEMVLNGTTTGGGTLVGIGKIFQKANTTYTFTYFYDSGTCTDYGAGLFLSDTPTGTTNIGGGGGFRTSQGRNMTLNTSTSDRWLYLYLNMNNNSTYTNYKLKLQIEEGTATTYEAFIGNTYPINLPVENLFEPTTKVDGTDIIMANGSIVLNDDEYTLTATGTDCYFGQVLSSGGSYTDNRGKLINVEGMSEITFTITNTLFKSNFITAYDSSKVSLGFTQFNSNTGTYTLPSSTKYITIRFGLIAVVGNSYSTKVQIEKGSKANSFTPYGTTPIELCKIGNYQDYFYKDSDKWYLHKEIGKVVLNGSESWETTGTQYESLFSAFISKSDMKKQNVFSGDLLSNYFMEKDFLVREEGITKSSQPLNYDFIILRIGNDKVTTLEELKTWLSTHNTTLYYVLATPTTTEITDATLIAQLNALANASSYDTVTHITQNANDKPFILNATALQQGSGEATVNNEGNIYSKPTLDIEGSGTVGIYLDGNQMFSVDLSNSSECVIDTTKLEAYNPTTSELMNRQVTGDYSNFKLNAGDNQVQATGEITKVTISNYTRWL